MTAAGDEQGRPEPWGLLLWLGAIAAWLAFYPFRLRHGPVAIQWSWQSGEETLGHMALLMPLAAILAAYAGASRTRLIAAAVVSAGVAVVLEAGQVFAAARAVSSFDLGAGLLGAAAAIAATRIALRVGTRAESIARLTFALSLAFLVVGTGFGSRAHTSGFVLERWNPGFVTVAGNEFDSTRLYEGQVGDALVCAGRPDEEICAGPEADEATRRALAELAERSQTFRLSAQVVSTGPQPGQARIVGFSRGPYGRNASLIQTDDAILLRVRTPRSGPNGIWMMLALDDAVPAAVPTRVEASYSRGRVELRATPEGGRTRYGVFAPPLRISLFPRGVRVPTVPPPFRGRGLAAATLLGLAGLGLLVGAFVRQSAVRRTTVAMALVLFVFGALSATLWGSPTPRFAEWFAAGIAGLTGALLGILDRGRGAFGAGTDSPDAAATS